MSRSDKGFLFLRSISLNEGDKDGSPAAEIENDGEEFAQEQVDPFGDSVVGFVGNEGHESLLAQAFDYVFVVFKAKGK